MEKHLKIYQVCYEDDLADETYRDEYFYHNLENAKKKYKQLLKEHKIRERGDFSEWEGERVFLSTVIFDD